MGQGRKRERCVGSENETLKNAWVAVRSLPAAVLDLPQTRARERGRERSRETERSRERDREVERERQRDQKARKQALSRKKKRTNKGKCKW